MRYLLGFIVVLVLSNCEKKKEAVEPAPSASTTTTGAVPTQTTEYNTAEFEVNSTDYNYGYTSARFYSEKNNTITMNSVKLNGVLMAMGPNNEYRTALSSSTYTSAVTWNIMSSVSYVPDTSFMSPAIPKTGFQKDISRTYDKTLDFTITVDAADCDSLFCTLGEVMKRIPGKKGITSITFYPSDKVKHNISDSTKIDVSVVTANYHLFNVRSKKWRSVSQFRLLSHYKYK